MKNWRRADWVKMRGELGKVDWKKELGGMMVDRMWAVLKRKVLGVANRHVPMKKIVCRRKPAWMNQDILAAI